MTIFSRSYFLFLSLFSACFLLSCKETTSKSNERPPIDAIFYVRYLESDKKFETEVSFYKTINKNRKEGYHIPGKISFLDKEMKAQFLEKVNTKRYLIDRNMPFSADQSFELMEENNSVASFPFTMASITDFTFPDPIIEGESFDIKLVGEPIKKNETVVLIMENGKRETISRSYNGPFENDKIRVLPAHLKGLSPGVGKLYLVRRRILAGKEKHISYKANLEYYSEKKTYNLSSNE